MNIVEVLSGKICPVDILPVEKTDYKRITKSRYFFDWKPEANYDVFKLILTGSNDILGLVSLEKLPEEWRIHIRLLTVSEENRGRTKKYDKIAGNLIVHASKIAVEEYGELACVSLRPKTEIAEHYVNKYKMRMAGMSLCLEVPEITDLINEYEYYGKVD